MKSKFKIHKRVLYRDIPVTLLAICMFACVYLDAIGTLDGKMYVKAGETATFTMDVRVGVAQGRTAKMVIAFLVPKSWNARQNSKVMYKSSSFANDMTMSLVPLEESPKNQQGQTWAAALYKKYGYVDNVLDDMEWVTYQSDYVWTVNNHDNITAKVKIEIKTSLENLRFKPAFFFNYTDDGLGGSEDHYKMSSFKDCFEVTEGEGPVIDFCELHFNMSQPLYATQDDILTFKFQGGIASNPLDDTTDIYMWAKAYTDKGNEYVVNEKSAKTKMIRENPYGKTYSLTYWPGGFFSIPDGETITDIDYYFTNADGSKWVKENTEEGQEALPFNHIMICK